MSKPRAKDVHTVNCNIRALPALLRKLRRAKDLSQQKVSGLLGIQYQSYQQYESGRSTPPPDKLAKLAELFGVTTDFLLGRSASLDNDNLDAVGADLAFREIMRALAYKPRKLAELRRSLEEFRTKL